jgi:hypothetical protein
MGKPPLDGGDSSAAAAPVDISFRRTRVGVCVHASSIRRGIPQVAVWRGPDEFVEGRSAGLGTWNQDILGVP